MTGSDGRDERLQDDWSHDDVAKEGGRDEAKTSKQQFDFFFFFLRLKCCRFGFDFDDVYIILATP